MCCKKECEIKGLSRSAHVSRGNRVCKPVLVIVRIRGMLSCQATRHPRKPSEIALSDCANRRHAFAIAYSNRQIRSPRWMMRPVIRNGLCRQTRKSQRHSPARAREAERSASFHPSMRCPGVGRYFAAVSSRPIACRINSAVRQRLSAPFSDASRSSLANSSRRLGIPDRFSISALIHCCLLPFMAPAP